MGLGLWEEKLDEAERKQLIELEVWKTPNQEMWSELGLDILDPLFREQHAASKAAGASADDNDDGAEGKGSAKLSKKQVKKLVKKLRKRE